MFKKLPDGSVKIGKETFAPFDPNKAKMARSTKATGDPLPGVFADGYGLPALQDRIGEITVRDSLQRRVVLEKAHADLCFALLSEKRGARYAAAIKTAKDLKEHAARPALEATVPPLLMELRQAIAQVIDGQAAKAKAAKDRLALALAAEVPTDPAAAVVAELRAQELRRRVAALSDGDRARTVGELAKSGRVAALADLAADPVSPCVPPDLLAGAQRQAMTVNGLDWLYDDCADQADGLDALRATAQSAYHGLVQAMVDAGVPAHLTAAEPAFRGFMLQKEGE